MARKKDSRLRNRRLEPFVGYVIPYPLIFTNLHENSKEKCGSVRINGKRFCKSLDPDVAECFQELGKQHGQGRVGNLELVETFFHA